MADEMQKCQRAWAEFERLAGPNILKIPGFQKPTHDAYVDFVHHLYEFYLAAMRRDAKDTKWDERFPNRDRHEVRDTKFSAEALRCVKSRIHAIEHKYAPAWENDLSYYQELLPLVQDATGTLITTFGTALREVRNHHAAHASLKRSTTSVIEFFKQYHPLVYLLFAAAWTWKNATSSIGEDFDLSPNDARKA